MQGRTKPEKHLYSQSLSADSKYVKIIDIHLRVYDNCFAKLKKKIGAKNPTKNPASDSCRISSNLASRSCRISSSRQAPDIWQSGIWELPSISGIKQGLDIRLYIRHPAFSLKSIQLEEPDPAQPYSIFLLLCSLRMSFLTKKWIPHVGPNHVRCQFSSIYLIYLLQRSLSMSLLVSLRGCRNLFIQKTDSSSNFMDKNMCALVQSLADSSPNHALL